VDDAPRDQRGARIGVPMAVWVVRDDGPPRTSHL